MKANSIKNFVACAMFLLALDVVSVTTSFAGGDKSSPRLVGMGRTFTASSRGLDAVGVNPANLALNDRDATVTINLAPVGFALGSDFINLQIYEDFFTGDPTLGINPKTGKNYAKFLTEDDKDKLLELFVDGFARTQAKVETAPIGLSLQIGNFGFAVVPSVQIGMSLDLEKEYLELFLRGLPNNKNYILDQTAVNAQAVAEMNASLAYILPLDTRYVSDIALGFGVKYLQGLAFIATDHYNASIRNISSANNPYGASVSDTIAADFNFLQWIARLDEKNFKPAGTGIGYDAGISMTLFDYVQFGASITDIGKIKWDKNTQAVVGNASVKISNIADTAQQNQFKNAFKGKTVDTTGFEFDLPTAVHVGFAVQIDDVIDWFPFRWLVAVDAHYGLNNIGGNTKIPQYAIGTEFDALAGLLPLRTGIQIGGRERFAWSGGFGIHLLNTFDLDFATQSLALITNPKTFRTGSFTMGFRLRF